MGTAASWGQNTLSLGLRLVTVEMDTHDKGVNRTGSGNALQLKACESDLALGKIPVGTEQHPGDRTL